MCVCDCLGVSSVVLQDVIMEHFSYVFVLLIFLVLFSLQSRVLSFLGSRLLLLNKLEFTVELICWFTGKNTVVTCVIV